MGLHDLLADAGVFSALFRRNPGIFGHSGRIGWRRVPGIYAGVRIAPDDERCADQ